MFNEMLRQFAPLTSISQGSAATHFRFDGIFNDGITAIFFSDSDSEQISKIG